MSALNYLRRVSATQIKPFNYEMDMNNTIACLSIDKMLECREDISKSDLPRDIKRSAIAMLEGRIRQRQKKAA